MTGSEECACRIEYDPTAQYWDRWSRTIVKCDYCTQLPERLRIAVGVRQLEEARSAKYKAEITDLKASNEALRAACELALVHIRMREFNFHHKPTSPTVAELMHKLEAALEKP